MNGYQSGTYPRKGVVCPACGTEQTGEVIDIDGYPPCTCADCFEDLSGVAVPVTDQEIVAELRAQASAYVDPTDTPPKLLIAAADRIEQLRQRPEIATERGR